MRFASLLWLITWFAASLHAQDTAALNKTLQELVRKIGNGDRYSWTGEYQMAEADSQGGLHNVTENRMTVARGTGGKQLFHVTSVSGKVPEFLIMSDGTTTWSYVPDKKAYTKEDSAPSERGAPLPLLESFDATMLWELAAMVRTAESLHSTVTEPVKVGKDKERWPVVDIIGKLDASGKRKVAQIVMAPDRPLLHRLTYLEMRGNDATTITSRVQVIFSSFQLEEPPADSFTFEVPKRAKLVEELAIFGLPGSILLYRPSPKIEANTLTGETFRLSSLQGKVVLLNFWASWCPPCRAELPTIAKLHEDLKDKGLVVYGVNDEDGKTALRYLEKAKLDIPTLDDRSHRVHSTFHISAIPTVFIIDRDGKVVQWLKGGHSEQRLRDALQQAGIE